MIPEAKAVLEGAVRRSVPDAIIVRSIAEEARAIMARKWPVVALITNPGRFDDRTARTYRYANAEAGIWEQRIVRGSRILPLLLRCWAEGEDTVDQLFSRILPAIPRKWNHDGFEGLIVINHEEHSDCTDSLSKLYLSVAEIQFTVDVATEAEVVPTISTTETEPELASL